MYTKQILIISVLLEKLSEETETSHICVYLVNQFRQIANLVSLLTLVIRCVASVRHN